MLPPVRVPVQTGAAASLTTPPTTKKKTMLMLAYLADTLAFS